MSNVKLKSGEVGDSVTYAAPAFSSYGTFRELLIERTQALQSLHEIERLLVRKCVDEGWEDCVRLNYNRISRRAK